MSFSAAEIAVIERIEAVSKAIEDASKRRSFRILGATGLRWVAGMTT